MVGASEKVGASAIDWASVMVGASAIDWASEMGATCLSHLFLTTISCLPSARVCISAVSSADGVWSITHRTMRA